MGDDLGPVPAAPEGARDDEAGRPESEVLATIAAQAGLRRIHFVAWRDLDDPEAGGSELHAHEIASRWAAAGLDVTFRTSAVPGAPASLTRDGYRVVRQAGRYAVFPGAAWEGIRMGHRPGDALVEIWNGMPFLSPVWYRGPRIVFLHHVHAEMWGMVLPPMLSETIPSGATALSDALRRRCLYHYVDYPDTEREARIIMARIDGAGASLSLQIARMVEGIRKEELRKVPGVAETLDWAAALVGLDVKDLHDSPEAVHETLMCLLKTKEDRARVTREVSERLLGRVA